MATGEQETSAVITDDAPEGVQVREGDYGARVIAVEPGGAEFIPLHERHGRPLQLFWTWTSPNLEFATVFVGVLAVAAFGLSFRQAVLAIVLGTGVGAITQGILSARGPSHGVPQMVLSRLGFGYWGNVLPAGLNSITAGIGWFAVNSVSGTFALNTLLHWPKPLCLVIIVAAQIAIAFFGYNLVHAFERYAFPVLAVIFVIATIVILSKSHPGAPSHGGGSGGFLLATGAAFGYAVGWNPYAADYTRYFTPDTSRKAIALWAGLGLFLSCVVLEIAGAGSATAASVGASLDDPTGTFTGHLPTVLADLTLLAIAIGAVAANVLNIYSGALSFVAMGIKLPLALRRAIVGAGLRRDRLHRGPHRPARRGHQVRRNFLLIIAYWIAPWLAVVFCDQFLRRREPLGEIEGMLFDKKHTNWAGPVAMIVGMGVSIVAVRQPDRVRRPGPHALCRRSATSPSRSGFVLTAAIYLTWHAITDRRAAAAKVA